MNSAGYATELFYLGFHNFLPEFPARHSLSIFKVNTSCIFCSEIIWDLPA
jgi:hypothetical protein